MDYRYFDAKDIVLENGLRVVTIKKDTSIASINLGVKVGSINEKADEKGLAHFIEHMMFKGTEKRNNERLNHELEFLGGDYNAYTDYTCTVFSIMVLQEEVENSLGLLSDMIINSNFPNHEIDKEKEVVLAEYSSSNDDIEDYSFKMINKIAFKNSPLKFDVIGEERIIKTFNRKKTLEFYKKYYVPNNSCITLVSSMDHEEALNTIKKLFSSWNYNKIEKTNPIKEQNISCKKINYKENIEQSTITYLYTFQNLDKHKELALRILNHRLGESANSILFRELREKRGLSYDVYTHLDNTRDIKCLYIYTAVKDKYVDEAVSVIDKSIQDIKDENININDDVLILMKKVLKTAVASTMEDSADLGNYVLHQCLEEEDIFQFVDDMKNIENVKREEVYAVAREVFCNPTVHILKSKR